MSSRVSVAVLDPTEVSLDGQKDPGVPRAAVLKQGGRRLPGAERRSGAEGGGWRQNTTSSLSIVRELSLVPGLSFNLRIHVSVILSRMEGVITYRASTSS